jgi:hypothetical protein
MKQIVWVFGTSASGKETFIKTLLSDTELQQTLGIASDQIAISEESLKNLGKLDKSRASIIDETARLLDTYEVILIKWQYGDTLLHTPNVLYSQYPAFRHTAIKLSVGEQEQKRRLQTKSWWHDIGEEDKFITKEVGLVEDSLRRLRGNFIVIEQEW